MEREKQKRRGALQHHLRFLLINSVQAGGNEFRWDACKQKEKQRAASIFFLPRFFVSLVDVIILNKKK